VYVYLFVCPLFQIKLFLQLVRSPRIIFPFPSPRFSICALLRVAVLPPPISVPQPMSWTTSLTNFVVRLVERYGLHTSKSDHQAHCQDSVYVNCERTQFCLPSNVPYPSFAAPPATSSFTCDYSVCFEPQKVVSATNWLFVFLVPGN